MSPTGRIVQPTLFSKADSSLASDSALQDDVRCALGPGEYALDQNAAAVGPARQHQGYLGQPIKRDDIPLIGQGRMRDKIELLSEQWLARQSRCEFVFIKNCKIN
jgi:hypothetical protein